MPPSANLLPTYKKPPVIEAVLAVHLAESASVKAIETFAVKRKAKFPRSEDIIETKFETNLKGIERKESKKVGMKLTSADGSRVIILRSDQFAVIHLPPYVDWESLYEEAREQWKNFSKILGHRSISRFSTRYVNRIDIPVVQGGGIDLQKFFNVGVLVPSPLEGNYRLQDFNSTLALASQSASYDVLLKFLSVQSPLIDYASFMLDIDLITKGVLPSKEEDAWAVVNSLRKAKYELFESCITDEARAIFQ